LHQDVFRYKSLNSLQLLNDLFWVVTSLNLLNQDLPEFKEEIGIDLIEDREKKAFSIWFQALCENPFLLESYFNSEDQLILGKYFERLVQFFFENYPRYELLIAGKQFFDRKTTLGELDFVIRDKTKNEVLHLEVAVKYYMGYKSSPKHSMWIGPNGLDTLEKKLTKFERQLALSISEESNIDFKIDRRIALLKGFFFIHWRAKVWPHFHINSLENGEWMYEEEMGSALDDNGRYIIFPKHLWLSFYLDPETKSAAKPDIMMKVSDQINTIKKGIMLVMIDEKEHKVLAKKLVVPSKWPRL